MKTSLAVALVVSTTSVLALPGWILAPRALGARGSLNRHTYNVRSSNDQYDDRRGRNRGKGRGGHGHDDDDDCSSSDIYGPTPTDDNGGGGITGFPSPTDGITSSIPFPTFSIPSSIRGNFTVPANSSIIIVAPSSSFSESIISEFSVSDTTTITLETTATATATITA